MQVWGSPLLLGENEEKRTGHMIVRPRLSYISLTLCLDTACGIFFEFSAIAFHMRVINMVAVKKVHVTETDFCTVSTYFE